MHGLCHIVYNVPLCVHGVVDVSCHVMLIV